MHNLIPPSFGCNKKYIATGQNNVNNKFQDIRDSTGIAALSDLEARRDVAETMHYMEMKHRAFGFIPILKDLTTIKIAANGSARTVNKASSSFKAKNPFAARHGPGFRGVYDFTDQTKTRFTISTGQSGDPYSFYYDNLVKDWRDVRHWTLSPDEVSARKSAIGVLTLTPEQ